MIGTDPHALVNVFAREDQPDPLPLAALLTAALAASGRTKASLAAEAGMSEQMLAKLFRPSHNATLPGVTAAPTKGSAAHLSIYTEGRFLAMAHLEVSRGALTGRIAVSRQIGRKLGPAVHGALLALAPCRIA